MPAVCAEVSFGGARIMSTAARAASDAVKRSTFRISISVRNNSLHVLGAEYNLGALTSARNGADKPGMHDAGGRAEQGQPVRQDDFAGSLRLTHVAKTDHRYLERLRTFLGEQAPTSIGVIGRLEILSQPTLGLFSSVHIPGALIVQMYDLAQRLRQSNVVVIGGFHS